MQRDGFPAPASVEPSFCGAITAEKPSAGQRILARTGNICGARVSPSHSLSVSNSNGSGWMLTWAGMTLSCSPVALRGFDHSRDVSGDAPPPPHCKLIRAFSSCARYKVTEKLRLAAKGRPFPLFQLPTCGRERNTPPCARTPRDRGGQL